MSAEDEQTPKTVFRGELADIGKVDVDAPLKGQTRDICWFYGNHFAKAAQAATEQKRPAEAHVYRFLQDLVTMQESFDTPEAPFRPFRQTPAGRSVVFGDLSPSDLEAVTALASCTSDVALKARLLDLLWVSTNDFRACGDAATTYLQLALEVSQGGTPFYCFRLFQRALQLARRLGPSKPLYQSVLRAVVAGAKAAPRDQKCGALPYLRLLVKTGEAPLAELVQETRERAEEREQNADWQSAKNFRQMEGDLLHANSDLEGERAVRLKEGELAVTVAEARATGPGAQASVTAELYVEAIELLRRNGGNEQRIEELSTRRRLLQRESMKEMQSFEVTTDITDFVNQERSIYEGKNFNTAVVILAFRPRTADPAQLRASVQEAAEGSISAFFPTAMKDASGRTVEKLPSLSDAQGDSAEAFRAMEAHMFQHASRFEWHSRSIMINTGRLEIYNRFQPDWAMIELLCRNSPFVPAGREEIFLRGIHAGFVGDLVLSTHLLVPQIENSLRYVLEARGLNVAISKRLGLEQLKTLGSLLALDETKEVIGESLVFELRGHLIEKTGYAYRDRLAHGFLSGNGLESRRGTIRGTSP